MSDPASNDARLLHQRHQQQLIERALAREEDAVQQLIAALTPTMRFQVAGVLRRGARRRDVRCTVDDIVQSVWLSLFERQGYILRTWDPVRGLTLERFVGLVAARHALNVVRSSRQDPYREDPTDSELFERTAATSELLDDQIATRQLFHELADRLRGSLTAYGMQMFEQLFIEGKSVEQVSEELSMCSDAVYAWRSRLMQRARTLARDILSETQPDSRTRRSVRRHER